MEVLLSLHGSFGGVPGGTAGGPAAVLPERLEHLEGDVCYLMAGRPEREKEVRGKVEE